MSNQIKQIKKRASPSVAAKRHAPKDQKATAISQVTQQQFSGPIPPPELLRQYNDIIPDAAERILRMAEHDAAHLHKIEADALKYAARDQRAGQLCALSVSIVVMLTVMLGFWLGYSTAASALGGTTVVGLVTVFVTGRNLHSKNTKTE